MLVSIDIGTSNSSICMMGADGNIISLDVSTGASIYGDKHSLPSAVFVEDSGNLVLGQAAMNNRMLKPQNFRAEFKRNLGEKYPIVLGSRSFLPEELYTEFFRYLVSCVRKLTNEPIDLAYLTYPATYGTSKKEKIVAAAKAAGLFHTELVDEPSAAAMNYCAEGHVHDKQNLLVYDFGGGTFDVSVIRYEDGEFRSLTGALGLERCGGVDIDRMIFQDMMSKIPADLLEMLKKNELYYMRFVSQLSESAVRCKKHLSSADIYSENIMVGFEAVSYSLTLERFNQMIAGLVGQTIQTCRQILADAKLQVSDLSAVLLVGGTSRIRLVREMVEQMAGSVPVYNAADLELIVSQGALNYRNYKVAPPKPEPKAETKQNEHPISNVKNGQKDDKKKELQIDTCRANDPVYLDEIGLQYSHEGQWRKAFECFQKAANMNYANAQYHLAGCYERGDGTPADRNNAQIWYHRAATQGHTTAAGKLKQNEHPVSNVKNGQKDDKKKELQIDTCRANDPVYLDEIGLQYSHEGQWRKAFECFQKAADMNYANAQYHLAGCYERGDGTPADRNNAQIWYHRAATQGHTTAAGKLKQNEHPVSNVKNGQKDDKKTELPNNRTSSNKRVYEKDSKLAVKNFSVDELLERISLSSIDELDVILPDGSLWCSERWRDLKGFENLRALCYGYGCLAGIRKNGTIVVDERNKYNVNDWKNIRKLVEASYKCGFVGLTEDGGVVTTDPTLDFSGWNNICDIISAPSYSNTHVYGLRNDGSVLAIVGNGTPVGGNKWRSHIKSICCSDGYLFGLREDGTVVTNMPGDNGEKVEAWHDICMIAAGYSHVVGLRRDGTVVAAGDNLDGRCNVSEWRNIKAVACGTWNTYGLREDGTVLAIGESEYGCLEANRWKNVIAIKAEGNRVAGICKDGRVRSTRYYLKEKRGLLSFISGPNFDAVPLTEAISPPLF